MARSKRKRSSTESKLGKKQQKTSATKDAYDSEQFWEIRGIIDENSTKYRIDWKDNPVTGESYSPTWEPKANANREAIIDWERKKQSSTRNGPGRSATPKSKLDARADVAQQTSDSYQTTKRTSEHQTVNRRKSRAASSAEDSTYIPSQVQESHQYQPSSLSQEAEIPDSLEQNKAIYSAQSPLLRVRITPRPDIDKSRYLEYSQSSGSEKVVNLPATQLESAPSENRLSLLSASFKPVQKRTVLFDIGSKTVIPDSQFGPTPSTLVTVSNSSSIPTQSQSSGHRESGHSPAKFGASRNSISILNTINSHSGFATFTGSQKSGEPVKTFQDNSGRGTTQNSGQTSHLVDQTDSWLTASAPILTAPIASSPHGDSKPNSSLHPKQPSQTFFSVSANSNPYHPTSSNSNSGAQKITSVSQKTTKTSEPSLPKLQSTSGNHSVSETSAAFQTQLPVTFSTDTTNDPTTESNSFDTSIIQQAAQVDPLIIIQPVSQFISSQEQAGDSSQPTTSGTTALHHPVEAASPVEAELDPRSINKRLSYSTNTRDSGILQSLEVDTATDRPNPEHQHASISSIPSPPSFSPAKRDLTFSPTPKMSESPKPPTDQGGASLRERLRNMRASFATSRMSPSRSPSIIPPHPPASATESINKPGSGVAQGLNAKETVNRTGLEQLAMSAGLYQGDGSVLIGKPLLGQTEFIVALPMTEEIRSQYEQAIFNNKDIIESFIRADKSDQNTKKKIAELTDMIEYLENLSVHADLAKSMSPEPMHVSSQAEARWAEFCSTKFSFLGHLLDTMRKAPTHIAILAEDGPLLDLLEKFLRAMKVKFHRPDNRAQSPLNLETPSYITLLPTGRKGANYIVSRATAVIVLDGSFNPKDDHVRSFRRHPTKAGRFGPAIHLVIANSAEHVDRCLPKDIDPTLRLKLLISCMTQARHEVGKLPAGYPGPAEAGKAVAEYLLKTRGAYGDLTAEDPTDNVPEWPLPPLGEVAGISNLIESQTSGDSVVSARPYEEGSVHVKSEEPQAQKRSLDTAVEGDVKSSKKQRLTPASAETTTTTGQITPVENANSEKEVIAELHAKLEKHKEVEAELRQTVSGMEEVLRGYGKDMTKARDEVEQQIHYAREMRKERDAAVAAVAKMREQQKAQSDEISKLKEDRTRLENEVQQAREALLRSDVPEKAELARLQEVVQHAQEEIASLQKKLELTQQDFDFTRAQYQTASSAAVEATTELETLRKENEKLAQEVGVERAKILEALTKRDEEEDGKKGEIGRLKRKIEEQDQVLRNLMGVVGSGSTRQGEGGDEDDDDQDYQDDEQQDEDA